MPIANLGNIKYILVVMSIFLGACNFVYATNNLQDISYQKIYTNKKQIIHITEIDPTAYSIVAAHASELGTSAATVSKFAERYNALVAINGGFFRTTKDRKSAVPAGILKIDNKWHGIAYKYRAAIGWYKNNKHLDLDKKYRVMIDVVNTSTSFYINRNMYKVNSFNPIAPDSKSSVFTFTNKSLLQNLGQCFLKSSGGIVKSINLSVTKIRDNEYVFSLGSKKCNLSSNLIGTRAYPKIDVFPEYASYRNSHWNEFDYIVGGAPVLVYAGKKNRYYKKELLRQDFINTAHARTAVGILENGNLVFVVVEEDPLRNIIGMNIPELIEYMHKLGCEYAINLDGGGSSSLYLADDIAKSKFSEILNFSLMNLRPVTDAILVLPK